MAPLPSARWAPLTSGVASWLLWAPERMTGSLVARTGERVPAPPRGGARCSGLRPAGSEDGTYTSHAGDARADGLVCG